MQTPRLGQFLSEGLWSPLPFTFSGIHVHGLSLDRAYLLELPTWVRRFSSQQVSHWISGLDKRSVSSTIRRPPYRRSYTFTRGELLLMGSCFPVQSSNGILEDQIDSRIWMPLSRGTLSTYSSPFLISRHSASEHNRSPDPRDLPHIVIDPKKSQKLQKKRS